MRCVYCDAQQDEPAGAKTCIRCGGQLAFVLRPRRSVPYCKCRWNSARAGGTLPRPGFTRRLRRPPRRQAGPRWALRPCWTPPGLDARRQDLKQAQDAVRQALSRLHDGDGLALVVFSSDVRCIVGPTKISDQTRRVVRSLLDEITAGGMTALSPGS